MHLNQWLEQVAEEEMAKTSGLDLDNVFEQLGPDELLKIACGESDLAKVLEERQKIAAVMPDNEEAMQKLASDGVGGGFKEWTRSKKKRGETTDSARKGLAKVITGPRQQEATQKLAFVDSLARQVAHTHTGIQKAAGLERPEQPRARDVIQGRGPQARAARTALREKLRSGCPVGEEIDKSLVKEDAFTSPEAKAKAKVMSSALKASKGAPSNVRKAAVAVAGKQLQKTANALTPPVGGKPGGITYGKALAGIHGAGAAAGLGYLALRKGRGKRAFRALGQTINRLRSPSKDAAQAEAMLDRAKGLLHQAKGIAIKPKPASSSGAANKALLSDILSDMRRKARKQKQKAA
ncbi:MAG: hypothetical protein KAY24_13675 [Candidatus Eisenbacteria sp.]|nr:hypothetical protein [Candidatus Eisenbacteria bacterium]